MIKGLLECSLDPYSATVESRTLLALTWRSTRNGTNVTRGGQIALGRNFERNKSGKVFPWQNLWPLSPEPMTSMSARVATVSNISLGDGNDCANFVCFTGLQPLLPPLCPVSVRRGGGVMWGIWALEKGYLEHPGSACCTEATFETFVCFGQCLCSLLPVFVNRQLPCPHTNSSCCWQVHRSPQAATQTMSRNLC